VGDNASNVISRPSSVVVELNAIAKIRKYERLHEGHHFIPMALEVHCALGCDMDHFIMECVCLFQYRRSKNHLSLFFCIHFLRQHVNISFQRALVSVIERKIVLVGDVYSRPPIRSHELHVSDIRKVVGEITSYHETDQLSPFFGSYGLCIFWPFLGLPFLFPL
jgi:hypothetical protein